MTTPTGPMDPEQLAACRGYIHGGEVLTGPPGSIEGQISEWCEGLLAAHNHHVLTVTGVRARVADLEAEVEGLRNVARGLAHAVVHRLPVTAYDLAAQVLEGDARGTL